MVVRITVLGAKRAAMTLETKKNAVNIGKSGGINMAAIYLQGEVKSSIAGQRAEPTSVDTGRFLNSVDVESNRDSSIIFSALDYSKYLEYGTNRISPRKHFNNSLDRNRDKIKQIIGGTIRKAVAVSNVAGMSWGQFMKGKMGPYMKSEGGHTGAMKRLGAEWKTYKAGK